MLIASGRYRWNVVDPTEPRADVRARIIDVAAELLREQGVTALTTRGVAERAKVQAPTIYRLFGDKDGLLDALAEHVMATFVSDKADAVTAARDGEVDPLDDLRTGWDTTIEFGIANPDLYVLLSDPARSLRSPAAKAGIQLLADRVHRVALAGKLALAEDRAVELIHAAGTGVILSTLARPVDERDRTIADAMFDAVAGQVLVDTGDTTAEPTAGRNGAAAGIALRARASDLTMLSKGERTLLAEWLDRIIAPSDPSRDLPQEP